MKTTDLRIGNFILFNGNSIDKVNIDIFNLMCENENHSISAIRLTPEVLECCGFELVSTLYIKNCISVEFYSCKTIEVCIFIDSFFNAVILKHINHLHQLQNLYFALTGEELEIDIEKLKTLIQ